MAGRNVGAALKPPDARRGWAVVLALPGGARAELSPGDAVELLRQLAEAVREWTRQTAAAGVVLALVDTGRDAAEADSALTAALVDALAPGRPRKSTRPPVARGA